MDTLSIFSSLAASLMILTSSLFVLIKDWRERVNRYYAFYSFCAFGILFTMFVTYTFPESEYLTRINRLSQTFTMLFFASVLVMSCVFPKSEKPFPFKIIFLILLPAFILGIVIALTDITITRAFFWDGMLIRQFRFFYNIYTGIVFIYLLAGTMNFIRKYRSTTVAVYRLQMKYVFVGGSLSILTAAVFSILLPRFFNYSRLYAIGPSIATVINVAALFYSIIAYNLMDIKTVIHKTALYLSISTLIILPVFMILYFYENGEPFFTAIPAYIATFVIVVIFLLFSVYVQPLIDKSFRRKQYRFASVFDEFARSIEEERDIQSVIRNSVKIVYNSLNLIRAFFMMIDERGRTYICVHYEGNDNRGDIQPQDRSASLARWLTKNNEILLHDRIYTDDKSFLGFREELSAFFVQYALKVILPVYHERMLLGFFCLGEKETLKGYRTDEINKLKYFSDKSGRFISTALTYKKAMKEQMLTRTVSLSAALLAGTLPGPFPRLNKVRFGAFIIPKYGGACDYYDYILHQGNGFGLIATDISGAGIQGALYAILLKSSFKTLIPEAGATGRVMRRLNKTLTDYTGGKGSLVTAFYLYCDLNRMRLSYTNAGYPPPELFRGGKFDFESLDTEGIPLGCDAETAFGSGRTNLARGDIAVIYSRSLITSKNQQGDRCDLFWLRKIISENHLKNAAEIAEAFKISYERLMGISTSESDVVVIVMKIN